MIMAFIRMPCDVAQVSPVRRFPGARQGEGIKVTPLGNVLQRRFRRETRVCRDVDALTPHRRSELRE
jgi:hypothetical protein